MERGGRGRLAKVAGKVVQSPLGFATMGLAANLEISTTPLLTDLRHYMIVATLGITTISHSSIWWKHTKTTDQLLETSTSASVWGTTFHLRMWRAQASQSTTDSSGTYDHRSLLIRQLRWAIRQHANDASIWKRIEEEQQKQREKSTVWRCCFVGVYLFVLRKKIKPR